MDALLSAMTSLDALSGQFAAALQQAEWQIYPLLAVTVAVGYLIISWRDRPDQF